MVDLELAEQLLRWFYAYLDDPGSITTNARSRQAYRLSEIVRSRSLEWQRRLRKLPSTIRAEALRNDG